MDKAHLRRKAFLAIGLLALVLFVMACSKGEKTAAPAPATPAAAPAAAPVAAPSPAPAPAQPAAAPAATPAPAAPAAGKPKYTSLMRETRDKYAVEKLPRWEKAKYGGFLNVVGWAEPSGTSHSYPPTKYLSFTGALRYGTLLQADIGVCSMAGRTDFSVCPPGTPVAKASAIVTVPNVIERWQQTDPVTWLFTVRKGVLWPAIPPMIRADREVTADDIKYDWTIYQTNSVHADVFNFASKVEVLDRYNLKITLKEPLPDFLRMMTNQSYGIFPRECYEEKDCMDTKIISPGPWLLKQVEIRVSSLYERNPEYYMKGLPYMDGIRMVAIGDAASVRSAFFTGKIDFAGPNPDPADIKLFFDRVPGMRFSIAYGPGGHVHGFMDLSKPPFNDVRVRQALSMAIDRQALYQAVGGLFMDTGIFAPIDYFPEWYPDGPAPDEMPASWQYNPQKAKELLTAAGFPNGLTLVTNERGTPQDYALVLQQMWKKNLNVDLKIRAVEPVVWVKMQYEGGWEGIWAATFCYIPSCGRFDADSYLQMYYSPSALNKAGKNNTDPTYDAMYKQQHTELDPAKRQDTMRRMAMYIEENVLALHWGTRYFFHAAQPWIWNSEGIGYIDCGYNACVYGTWIDVNAKPK